MPQLFPMNWLWITSMILTFYNIMLINLYFTFFNKNYLNSTFSKNFKKISFKW